MAFFHGMVLFFRRGAKLSPSEHRITFEESTGQKSIRQINGLNHFVNPSLGNIKIPKSFIPRHEMLKTFIYFSQGCDKAFK